MAKAQPAPMVATIRPDSSGPKMWVALCEMLISALASCSRCAPTICGIRPIEAGMKKAAALPMTTAKAISCQISALPVISSVDMTAWAAGANQVAGDHHAAAAGDRTRRRRPA